MKTYDFLNKIPGLGNSYSRKFLFVTFIGVHLPLIGIIFFQMFRAADSSETIPVLLALLACTLFATAVTLFFVNQLLQPIVIVNRSLQAFIQQQQIPELPSKYTDEAGVLLNSIQHAVSATYLMTEEKKDLISMLSHDLRTPISQTVTLARIIKNEEDKASVNEICDHIIRASLQELDLLEGLLNLLRQEDQLHQHLPLNRYPVAKVVNEAVEKLRWNIQEKQLHIVCNIAAETDSRFNYYLFLQVVVNLLNNAVKFSYQGGEIILSATWKNEKMCLTVQDHGKGFDQQHAGFLFEKFTRYGEKGTAGEPTTGLGLYLSKRIVEFHGGSISATSNGKEKGATFTVCLPD